MRTVEFDSETNHLDGELRDALAGLGGPPALVLALRRAQKLCGYLPEGVLDLVSVELDIPISRVYAVATSVNEFSLKPKGRVLVTVCRGSACGLRGGQEVLKAVQRHLGVSEGEPTKDFAFSYETVACFGNCSIAPAMQVDETLFGGLSPERAVAILKERGGAQVESG